MLEPITLLDTAVYPRQVRARRWWPLWVPVVSLFLLVSPPRHISCYMRTDACTVCYARHVVAYVVCSLSCKYISVPSRTPPLVSPGGLRSPVADVDIPVPPRVRGAPRGRDRHQSVRGGARARVAAVGSVIERRQPRDRVLRVGLSCAVPLALRAAWRRSRRAAPIRRRAHGTRH